jgi:hypothetical protein
MQDLVGLLGVGRNDLDMLVLTPRQTSNGLIVMVRNAELQVVYPQAGWLDWKRVGRFWLFSLRMRLSPRFERWGRELIHRANLGSDATRAANLIDEFFGAIFQMSGPFALKFTRQGWAPLA